MVGSPSMNLHGWRQLAEWSIDFCCLSDGEKNTAHQIFRHAWEQFCEWIVKEYGAYAASLEFQIKPTL
jgi:adenosine deaminase CECR1